MSNKYIKITKILMWVLLAIGVGIVCWAGFIAGLPSDVSQDAYTIDVMLYWAYALIVVAVLAIIVLLLYTTAKQKGGKGILKLLGVILGACVLVAGSYLLARSQTVNGDPLVLPNGTTPEYGEMVLANTVINLTYLSCIVAVLAILFSAIYSAVRK